MSTHTHIVPTVWSVLSAIALAYMPAQDESNSKIVVPPDADAAEQALIDSPRHGEWVDIDVPGTDTSLHTWVVYPERSDKAPVVIVIHEIFGLTDWVRGVADRLAGEGFIAVAPDLLSGMGPDGGGTESLGENVRSVIRTLSDEETAKRLNAARAWAIDQPSANENTASIGFCWGGSASFEYATQQPELDCAVVYYGTAPDDMDALSKIDCPVLGHYGGDDARVTSTVESTRSHMSELDKTYTTHVYDAAGHGFLRQQSGRDGANQKAAAQAWARTVRFLNKHLY